MLPVCCSWFFLISIPSPLDRSNYRNWRKGGTKGSKGSHEDRSGEGHVLRISRTLRMLEDLATESDVFSSEDFSEIHVLQSGYRNWRKGKSKGAHVKSRHGGGGGL